MNKYSLTAVNLKWRSIFVLAVVMLLASCSNGVKDDLNALYNTIPEKAAVVVSGNFEKIASQLGAELDDGQIKSLGKSGLSALGGKDVKDELRKLQKRTKGMKIGAFAGFVLSDNFYMTFMLSDADLFMKNYAREAGGSWEKSGGYYYLEDCVVVDDRCWTGNNITVDKVKDFMDLSEVESFLSCEYAETMASSNDAITFWASVDGLVSGLGFAEQAQVRTAVSMLYSNPEYIVGNMNFKKNSAESEIMLVKSDYKPAKCVIEMEKIDASTVGSLGGNANTVFAMGISSELVKKIKNLGSSMGGGIPSEMWDMISPLEGTIAVASTADISNDNPATAGAKAIISTNGKKNALLGQALEEVGDVQVKGDNFIISKGNYGKGRLDVAETGKEMKDAWIGVAFAAKEDGTKMKILLLLEPKDGTLALRSKVEW